MCAEPNSFTSKEKVKEKHVKKTSVVKKCKPKTTHDVHGSSAQFSFKCCVGHTVTLKSLIATIVLKIMA
jgi:hypothetical protein